MKTFCKVGTSWKVLDRSFPYSVPWQGNRDSLLGIFISLQVFLHFKCIILIKSPMICPLDSYMCSYMVMHCFLSPQVVCFGSFRHPGRDLGTTSIFPPAPAGEVSLRQGHRLGGKYRILVNTTYFCITANCLIDTVKYNYNFFWMLQPKLYFITVF